MARLGFEAKMLVNDLPLDIIGDIAIEIDYTDVEVKNRESRNVRTIRGMRTHAIDITVENVPSNPAYSALVSADKTDSPVKITVKEDDSDTDPFEEYMEIIKISRQYPIDDKMVRDVALRISANPPTTP